MRLAVAVSTIGCLAALQFPGAEALAQSQPFVLSSPGTRVYSAAGGWFEIDSVDGTTVRTVSEKLELAVWTGLATDA